jgi:antitoxin (DNA-binding transcriptional repressor) of toxin-antitoxin stability system
MTTRIGIEKVKRNWERVIAKVERGDEIIVCRLGQTCCQVDCGSHDDPAQDQNARAKTLI